MASDIKTTSEDADMAECDGEKVVTMMDVLQEQEDFEEDANAVLGASDDKECTYSKGYIKRQAIYACMTCCPEARSDSSKRAGVCLACSLMCHENHELVELYTKRNFRCDCGNPKFNSHPCTFTPNKTDLNEDNYYNQNFSGLYCTCQRPYPDPESTVEDEMIQCIICEDWLHASHLESTVPSNEQYSEMICKMCMEKNDFLHDYSELAVNIENVDVDVVQINGKDAHNPKLCNGDAKAEDNDSTLSENVKTDVEMEEKSEENVTATETSTLKGKESENESKDETVSKVESDNNDKKDESMEVNQTEQFQSDATSEETSATVSDEPTEKIEQDSNESENNPDSIPKTDDISKDVSDEPTTDKIENSSDITTPADQSENNESKEQENEETNKLKDAPSNEAEKSKTLTEHEIKANEQNAEKMEEDKLLADPDDSTEKTESSEENKNATEKNIASNDTVTNENDKPKSEIEPNSEISEKPNPSEEKLDSEVSENAVANENDSNIDNASEINTSTSNITSSDNKPENVTEEDKNTAESTVANESIAEESSSSEKISEKRKLVEESSDNKEAKKQKLDNICVRPKGVKKIYKGATFWPSNFRQKLCTCQECISMYNDLSVLFLTDPEDTVTAYENLGKQKINGKPTTQYERGLQALSSLDRIQQINALTEYNRMRDRLLDFLKSFKDRKEIVKEEDIKAFFAGMRPKREPDGVYFCR